MIFLGIDLCGPRMTLVEAGFEPRDRGDPVQVRKVLPVADEGPSAPPLWEHLRQRLRLRPDPEMAKPEDSAQGRLELVLLGRGAKLREAIAEIPDPGTPVAVVYPYATPPVLRRYLPMLFLAGQKVLPDRGGHPIRPLIGLEAPVALAIEAVARRACSVPEDLLLVTGSGPTRELTAASVSALTLLDADPRLWVQVRASFPTETSAQVEEAAERVRALPARDGWRLVAAAAADDLAAALRLPAARSLPWPDPAEAAAVAPALGAIRFAGVRRGAGLPMLGELSSPVEIEGICPAPLGVVGTNGRGEWIWHRLAPAGTPLPTPETLVQTTADKPGPRYNDPILLAECLHPSHHHDRWLHQDDWEAAGLSFHEHARATNLTRPWGPPLEPDHHAWIFKLKPRDDSWGLLSWSILYKGPTPTSSPPLTRPRPGSIPSS